MSKQSLGLGSSRDAVLLMAVKLITTVLGLVTTRLLSEYLSLYDYGTYSQITLIASVVSSATILGMMDGVNYFFHSDPNPEQREKNVCSIFTLQCMVGTVAGGLVLALSSPLCAYFENPKIRNLLIFAAALPLLQNLIGMMQVLLVAAGKAALLAIRNFVVSALRLLVVMAVVVFVGSVPVVLLTTVVLDLGQILFFYLVLRKQDCTLHFQWVSGKMLRRILGYCAPMAVYTLVSALNRDVDKYLVATWTDTQTLAIYSNASRVLPFDIVITSFTTVLLPRISHAVATGEKECAAKLYRQFLEIAYISTTVLCCAALAASPQLMKLLYSNKYLEGWKVFCIYIVVDLLRFTNITMVLSAAGKTGRLMLFALGAVALNVLLNCLLFQLWGLEGLAMATLITTLVMGLFIMASGAKELGCGFWKLFDWKYLSLFFAENMVLLFLLYRVQMWLENRDVHYFVILLLICGSYCLIMLALNGKRLLRRMKHVN